MQVCQGVTTSFNDRGYSGSHLLINKKLKYVMHGKVGLQNQLLVVRALRILKMLKMLRSIPVQMKTSIIPASKIWNSDQMRSVRRLLLH